MKLTSYFRSTAAYRVRIALNLKQINYDIACINLLSGEQQSADFLSRNPEGLVPTLDTQGRVLAQSMAILEYLEEAYPASPLLPAAPLERAYVRGLAHIIVSDMHPLNNLRVQQYLVNQLGVSEEDKLTWYRHWVAKGFTSLERRLSNNPATGSCCFNHSPTLADVCLIPQVYNARRFDCPLQDYPTIKRIETHCLSLPEFNKAQPERQIDAS